MTPTDDGIVLRLTVDSTVADAQLRALVEALERVPVVGPIVQVEDWLSWLHGAWQLFIRGHWRMARGYVRQAWRRFRQEIA